MTHPIPSNIDSPPLETAETAAQACLRPLVDILRKLNRPSEFAEFQKFTAFSPITLNQIQIDLIALHKKYKGELSKGPLNQERLAALKKKVDDGVSKTCTLITSLTCDADYYVGTLTAARKKINSENIPEENFRNKFQAKMDEIDQSLRNKVNTAVRKRKEGRDPDLAILSAVQKTQRMYADLINALTSSGADYYLEDFNQALRLAVEKKNAFKNEGAKQKFINKLTNYKATLEAGIVKELSKMEKANVYKLDGAKKIAAEQLKMLRTFNEAAISECYENCSRDPWWKNTVKVLGEAIEAACHLIGSAFGRALFPIDATASSLGSLAASKITILSSSKIGIFVPHNVNQLAKGLKDSALEAIRESDEKRQHHLGR